MQFFKNLYLGETVASKVNQMIKKINSNQAVPNLYLIAIASNPENMLELIPAWEVMQKGYPKEQLQIIGLANGKKEAVGLVQYMVEESLQKTGNADVRQYLKQKWEEQA